jgi:hypothetical protein
VPFSLRGVPVTEHFVPREDELERLETFFQSVSDVARQRVFVVHGMGGIGKTQLCVEYVRKHKADFSAILWVDGSSKDALRQSFASAGARLSKEGTHEQARFSQGSNDIDESVDAFIGWLSSPGNSSWLIVIDNADLDWQVEGADPQAYDYRDFLPHADQGSVLITTRLARLQIPEASLHLQNVSDDLGRKMIEQRAGKRLFGTLSAQSSTRLHWKSTSNILEQV